jgi:hypothetical protein
MKLSLSVLLFSLSVLTLHSAHAQNAKNVVQKEGIIALGGDKIEPNIQGATATQFYCELGNKVTTYQHAGEKQSITLRWKNRLLHLVRVDTNTGANRFENRQHGLVWINLPAKSILLDSKKGQQLANECKSS